MNTLTRKLHAFWIVTQSIYETLKYSCLAIYRSYFHQRLQIDQTIHAWAAIMLRIVGAKVTVHNPHGITLTPGNAYILMSNHNSLYDIPLIFETMPGSSIRMIAKKELLNVPLWGHAMKACEFMGIDRKNSAQAVKDLELVREKMRSGIVPWIAPEGTRSRDGKLGVFKKGGFMLAIQTSAIIIPIAIRGAAKILPPKTLNFQTDQPVEIFIGKPVDASQYTVVQRTKLLQEVREQIEEMLDGFPSPTRDVVE